MAYKVVQSNPTENTSANLYTVPASKQAVASTLAICNFGTDVCYYTVWVRPSGAAAADSQLLVSGSAVDPSDTVLLTAGLALSASDVVTVKFVNDSGGAGDITFSLFVNEVDA